jgi:uncharacterized membrane protein (UPF0136 family)
MSGTIALRNIALFSLCVCLTYLFSTRRPTFLWPIPVLLWAAYLFAFPLVSESPIQSLLEQWGRGLLAMLVGAGVATVFYKRRCGSAFDLGLVSSVPILIHLCFFAWTAWETSSIPWGYWGRETHHADIGYAAGQSVVLLAAAVVAGNRACRPWASVLIIACLLSITLANSRAGLAFSLVGGLLVLCGVYAARGLHHRKHVLAGLASLLIIGMAVFSIAVKEDPRWRSMTAQLMSGFSGDALQIECEGTAAIESQIIAQYGSGEEGKSIVFSVQGGDGARMVLLRAGVSLSVKHPMGSDGSRLAYQNLLREECADPVILMAHTHNGWLDTALALGWAGAALYLMVLMYFFSFGYTNLRQSNKLNEWALVLVALAAFWMLRGFTDSVFKDHMLEMQGFVLAYAAVNLWTQGKAPLSAL